MVFQCSGKNKTSDKFKCNGNVLANVNSVSYLCVVFISSGSFSLAASNLADKGKKVAHMLNRKVIYERDVSLLFETQLYLFET